MNQPVLTVTPSVRAELVAADALLAAAHQVGRLKPQVQLDVAALEHRADRHAALLAAGVALVEARPGRGAAHTLHAIRAAAVRADGAVRPDDALQLRIGGVFVLKEGWLRTLAIGRSVYEANLSMVVGLATTMPSFERPGLADANPTEDRAGRRAQSFRGSAMPVIWHAWVCQTAC